MNRELIEDYLRKSEFDEMQSEALSRVLAEMVTQEELKAELAALKAELTWRIIAIVGFFATVSTILNAFLD